jgi:PAS domain-containing protein
MDSFINQQPVSTTKLKNQPKTASRAEGLKLLSKDELAQNLLLAEREAALLQQRLDAAMKAVSGERQRYQEFFDALPIPCLVTDMGGCIEEANLAAGGLLEVPAKRLKGKDLTSLMSVSQRSSFVSRLSSLAGHAPKDKWVLHLVTRLGEPISVEATMLVCWDHQKQMASLRWLLNRECAVRSARK